MDLNSAKPSAGGKGEDREMTGMLAACGSTKGEAEMR